MSSHTGHKRQEVTRKISVCSGCAVNPFGLSAPRPRRHIEATSAKAWCHVILISYAAGDQAELLQGTLDVMILQTPSVMGPMHGYGIARYIEYVSGDEVLLNQRTIYAARVRLQGRQPVSLRSGESQITIASPNSIRSREKVAQNWQRLRQIGRGWPELMYRVLRMAERKRKENLRELRAHSRDWRNVSSWSKAMPISRL